jgi:hypothetical protein
MRDLVTMVPNPSFDHGGGSLVVAMTVLWWGRAWRVAWSVRGGGGGGGKGW